MTINFQYTEATNSDDATTEAESETDTSSETESETANETEPAEILSGTLYVGEQAEDGSYYVQLDGSNNIYLMSADKLSAFQGLNYDDYPESEEESTESGNLRRVEIYCFSFFGTKDEMKVLYRVPDAKDGARDTHCFLFGTILHFTFLLSERRNSLHTHARQFTLWKRK